jgi:membrane protein implicated in regulation of membrane protease activity
MTQQPIFFAVTRSFWLTVGGIAMVLEQGEPVVRAIVTMLATLAAVAGISWDVVTLTSWVMEVAPAILWVAAMQQRAHAARPYTVNPKALK